MKIAQYLGSLSEMQRQEHNNRSHNSLDSHKVSIASQREFGICTSQKSCIVLMWKLAPTASTDFVRHQSIQP